MYSSIADASWVLSGPPPPPPHLPHHIHHPSPHSLIHPSIHSSSLLLLLIPPSLGSAVPIFAPTLPWSPQLAWASFLDGLVGICEASRIAVLERDVELLHCPPLLRPHLLLNGEQVSEARHVVDGALGQSPRIERRAQALPDVLRDPGSGGLPRRRRPPTKRATSLPKRPIGPSTMRT